VTKPWTVIGRQHYARRAASLASGSAFSSPSAPNGIRVNVTGKTNLHNYYPEAWRRADKTKRGPTVYGRCYTTRRTARSAKAVAHVHARLSYGRHVYLLTHTMNDAASEKVRRRMFRKLLDRVRKLPWFLGYMWTTERHIRGQLHHHLVLRMARRWDYTRIVVSWSQRYCGSPNGLDIALPPTVRGTDGDAAIYAAKGFWYSIKGIGSEDELPFRWWGTSRVVRNVEVSQQDLPTVFSAATVKPWPVCAYVSARYAIELCALPTLSNEVDAHVKRWPKLAPP